MKPAPRNINVSPHHVSQKRFLQRTRVYVMHNIPFFFVNKFGISDKPNQRRTEVSTSTPGYVFRSVAPRLEFGWHVEQFVHGLYRFQRIPFSTGSGKNEWFLIFSPVVGTLCWYIDTRYQIGLTRNELILCYFCPFIWWDAFLWLLVFSMLRILLFIALGFLLIYLGAHLQF